MAFAVSAYSSGRAGSAAITPAREAAPDSKSPSSLNLEDNTGAGIDSRENGSNEAELRAAREAKREDIRKLEQIRAAALYPAPATAKERSVAQLAHTQIIRAEAELRAQEFETIRQRSRVQDIARFHAAQAAAAYRELDQVA